MNPTDNIIDFISQRKWIPLAAAIIWVIVRLLKSDTKIPVDIPPRVRALVAVGLGAAAGALDKLIAEGSTSWQSAILNGLLAGVGAIFIHSMLIDTARGGKEIPLGPLTIPGARPAPGKPVTDPPPPPANNPLVTAMLWVGAMFVVARLVLACGHGSTACAVVDVAKQNCDLWIRYLDKDGQVREVQIPKEEANQLARTAAAKQQAQRADGGAP